MSVSELCRLGALTFALGWLLGPSALDASLALAQLAPRKLHGVAYVVVQLVALLALMYPYYDFIPKSDPSHNAIASLQHGSLFGVWARIGSMWGACSATHAKMRLRLFGSVHDAGTGRPIHRARVVAVLSFAGCGRHPRWTPYGKTDRNGIVEVEVGMTERDGQFGARRQLLFCRDPVSKQPEEPILAVKATREGYEDGGTLRRVAIPEAEKETQWLGVGRIELRPVGETSADPIVEDARVRSNSS